ncbi:hypothetical protein SDJN03_11720, partial [Cucurbita argyrosperma subsp. sororia]
MGRWLNPLPRGQLGTSACYFVAGFSFFAVGAYLSYVNIGPQQARTKARSDFGAAEKASPRLNSIDFFRSIKIAQARRTQVRALMME